MLRCIHANQTINRIYRKQIRCVLEFENNIYLILKESEDQDILIKSEWDFHSGFKYIEEEIPQKVVLFAKKIIVLNKCDYIRYPLKGEWYSVNIYPNGERLKWSITRTVENTKTSLIMSISFLLKLLITMAFAGLITYCTNKQSREWINAIFPMLTRRELKITAIIFEFLGSLVMFILFKEKRELFDLYMNAFIPYGIVLILGLLKCYWWMWIVLPLCMLFAFGVAVIYMNMILCKVNIKFGECARIILIIITVLLALFVSFTGLDAYAYKSHANEISEMQFEEAEQKILENCYKLENKIWHTLTTQEKLDLLQLISDFECKFILGCPEIRVYAGITNSESIWGSYSDKRKSCIINENHLNNDDSNEVLSTLLHEVRHAYQSALIEMYYSLEARIKDEYRNLLAIKQVEIFSDEFDDYYTGENDFDKYYYQTIEKDSRVWAEKRIAEYYGMFIYPNR